MFEGCLYGMDNQRRVLLQALGAGLGLGSAGCLTRGQTQETPTENTAAERTDQGATAMPAEDGGVEAAEEDVGERTAMTEAEARLAATTNKIMDELAWFATEYPGAIEAFKEAGEAVTSTVSEVGEAIPLTRQDVRRLDGEIDRPRMDQGWPWDIWWEKGEKRWRRFDIDWQEPSEDQSNETPLDQSAIERLREKTEAFADTFEEELQPHFSGAEKERQFGADTIDVIDRFNAMGDTAMVVAGLVRLFEHYESVTGSMYVQENLSKNPIRNRLAGYLSAPKTEETPLPALFEVDYRGQSDHQAFAYRRSVSEGRTESLYRAEPTLSIDGSTWDSEQLRLHDVVDGLEVTSNRVDCCYCLVSAWENRDSGYYSADLPSQTIFVQRYRTIEAAGKASKRLFDRTGVAKRGQPTKTIDGKKRVEWQLFTFHYKGEIWYGIFRRVGRHVLVASLGRQPFEHRSSGSIDENWQRLLGFSWLGAATDT